MARTEFTVKIMRQARDRSGGLCEAVGADYGLAPGCRCNGDLSKGVQFDHVVPDGLGGLATLENCEAVCGPCHRRKTAKVDVPRISKAKRRETRHLGIKKPSSFACSKASPWKKRMDGSVVSRATGEPRT